MTELQRVVRDFLTQPIVRELRRRDHIASVTASWQNPETREKHRVGTSAGMIARWKDPIFRAKTSAVRRAVHQRPETRAKHRAAREANWRNPAYRERQRTKLNLDHCHETGMIRALLCSSCNLMIGNAKESVARLRAAADYLERFADQTGENWHALTRPQRAKLREMLRIKQRGRCALCDQAETLVE